LVRKIAAVLDRSWVHAELAAHYPNNGRPSIDPELMIRMLIIGYVFAIRYCLISAPTRRLAWNYAAPRCRRGWRAHVSPETT
jgi:hypothetical protein